MVSEIERDYGLYVYWLLRRTYSSECPIILYDNSTCLFDTLGPISGKGPYAGVTPQVKTWHYNEIGSIRTALRKIDEVLGHLATVALTRGGVLARVDVINSYDSYAAQHCPGGFCGDKTSFQDVSYALLIGNAWTKKSGEGKQMTLIHEYGHRLDHFLEKQPRTVLQEFYQQRWDTNGSPTLRAREGEIGEYVAETFAVYIWKQVGYGDPPDRNDPVSLQDITSPSNGLPLDQIFHDQALGLLP